MAFFNLANNPVDQSSLFVQRFPQVNMANYLSANSQFDPDSYQPDEYLRMEGRILRREKELQWTDSTGLGPLSTFTQVFFTYLGGMYVARQQFIFNPLYFSNSQFNWIKGGRYMFVGYLFGSVVSALNWGMPYNLEDMVRGFFRGFTVARTYEMGLKPQ